MNKNLTKSDNGLKVSRLENNDLVVDVNSLDKLFKACGIDSKNYIRKDVESIISFFKSHNPESSIIERNSNASLDTMEKLAPKDPIESLQIKNILNLQMILENVMNASIYSDQTSEGKDLNIERVLKLTKAISSLITTYSKYSRGGHQKVTVQHVNISDGGQAFVGNFEKK